MSVWSPREMPKLRDRALAAIAWEREQALTITGDARMGDEAANLAAVRNSLKIAELYWVTPAMVKLARDASESLTDACWALEYRPSPAGFLVFEFPEGAGLFDPVEGVPVRAVSWGPHPAGMSLWRWAKTQEMAAHGAATGKELVPEVYTMPALPIAGTVFDTGPQWRSMDGVNEKDRKVFALVQATWHLMTQTTITESQLVEADRKIRSAYGRAQRPVPSVRLIDLRRRSEAVAGDGQQSNRKYQHRWITSGHWRDQPCGPGRSQVRRIWIRDHIKGPDGAPMIGGEKVHVWRR